MVEIISQALGLLALGANIICYQLNDRRKILQMQILASVLFTVNLLLKGAFAGVLLNIHATIRLCVFYQSDRHKWAQHKAWIWFFCITAAGCVALTYESIFDAIALVGTVFTIISFSQKRPAMVRLFTLPSPPCWFAYHFSQHNIGGYLNEIFVFCSIIAGALRHDLPEWKKQRALAENRAGDGENAKSGK